MAAKRSKKILIRKSTDSLLAIHLHSITFPGDDFEDHPNNVYWIAWDGDAPVGFAIARETVGDDTTVFLSRCGVLDKYRGAGLQKRFIRVRLNWARREAFQNVITYCTLDNPVSANNLIGSGFKVYCPAYAWAGRRILYLLKVL